MVFDISILTKPPDHPVQGVLHIAALAPLSMVGGQAGSYYRSQPAPTESMLYGMLENALGWHFSPEERKEILNAARKAAKRHKPVPAWTKDPDLDSPAGYRSLLQHHLKFTLPVLPAVMHYDDLWSQQLRTEGQSYIGGSRTYDHRLEWTITLSRTENPALPPNPRTKKRPSFVEFGDKAKEGFEVQQTLEDALSIESGKIHYKALRSRFPQYYVSPKVREYVIPSGPYRFRVETTPALAELVRDALQDPAAPLYLGSSDGWVEAWWENLT
jgi:hypothetical protein